MKKQKKYKKIHRSAKILGAILLGVLVFSGSVLAMPKKLISSQEIMDGMRFSIASDFNYIDQWNKEFSEGYKGFDKNEYLGSLENPAEKEQPSE